MSSLPIQDPPFQNNTGEHQQQGKEQERVSSSAKINPLPPAPLLLMPNHHHNIHPTGQIVIPASDHPNNKVKNNEMIVMAHQETSQQGQQDTNQRQPSQALHQQQNRQEMNQNSSLEESTDNIIENSGSSKPATLPLLPAYAPCPTTSSTTTTTVTRSSNSTITRQSIPLPAPSSTSSTSSTTIQPSTTSHCLPCLPSGYQSNNTVLNASTTGADSVDVYQNLTSSNSTQAGSLPVVAASAPSGATTTAATTSAPSCHNNSALTVLAFMMQQQQRLSAGATTASPSTAPVQLFSHPAASAPSYSAPTSGAATTLGSNYLGALHHHPHAHPTFIHPLAYNHLYGGGSNNGNRGSSNKLRSGKWTREEEVYADRLIEQFVKGCCLDCHVGVTLRTYLSQKLHCAPMRISKKFAGQGIGKMIYKGSEASKASSAVSKTAPGEGVAAKKSAATMGGGESTPAAAQAQAASASKAAPLLLPSDHCRALLSSSSSATTSCTSASIICAASLSLDEQQGHAAEQDEIQKLREATRKAEWAFHQALSVEMDFMGLMMPSPPQPPWIMKGVVGGPTPTTPSSWITPTVVAALPPFGSSTAPASSVLPGTSVFSSVLPPLQQGGPTPILPSSIFTQQQPQPSMMVSAPQQLLTWPSPSPSSCTNNNSMAASSTDHCNSATTTPGSASWIRQPLPLLSNHQHQQTIAKLGNDETINNNIATTAVLPAPVLSQSLQPAIVRAPPTAQPKPPPLTAFTKPANVTKPTDHLDEEGRRRLRENYLDAISGDVETETSIKDAEVGAFEATPTTFSSHQQNERALFSLFHDDSGVALCEAKPLVPTLPQPDQALSSNPRPRPSPPLSAQLKQPCPLAAPPYKLLLVKQGDIPKTKRESDLSFSTPTVTSTTGIAGNNQEKSSMGIDNKHETRVDNSVLGKATGVVERKSSCFGLLRPPNSSSILPPAASSAPFLAASSSLALAISGPGGEGKQGEDVDDLPDFLLGFDRAVSKIKAEQQHNRATKTSKDTHNATTKSDVYNRCITAIDAVGGIAVDERSTDRALIVDHAFWQSTSPITSSRSFDDFHLLLGNHPDLIPLNDDITTSNPPALPSQIPVTSSIAASESPRTLSSTAVMTSPTDKSNHTANLGALDTASLFSAEVYAMFAKESAISTSIHEAYLSAHPEAVPQNQRGQEQINAEYSGDVERKGSAVSTQLHAENHVLPDVQNRYSLSNTAKLSTHDAPHYGISSDEGARTATETGGGKGIFQQDQHDQQRGFQEMTHCHDSSSSSNTGQELFQCREATFSSAPHYVESSKSLTAKCSKRKRTRIEVADPVAVPSRVSSSLPVAKSRKRAAEPSKTAEGDAAVVVSETSATEASATETEERPSSEASSDDQSDYQSNFYNDGTEAGGFDSFSSSPSTGECNNNNSLLLEDDIHGLSQSSW
ncbi:hypothetical protein ACA910_019145 [Epithemia clementina (nom. ined.)]